MKLNITSSTVEELADEFIQLKKQAEQKRLEAKAAEETLIRAMTREQRKTVEFEDGGKYQRVTYVQTERTKVDEEGLQAALGKVRYRKLCDLKINRKKLEDALDEGQVSMDEVKEHVTSTYSEPYVRYTEGAIRDDRPA